MTCQEWPGAVGNHGYGVKRVGDRLLLAHRLALAEHLGVPIEHLAGKVVRHECDNRRCINPLHLKAGTQLDNVRDMVQKGRARHVYNEEHGRCKLTNREVSEIRATHIKGSKEHGAAALGRKYGVSHSHILSIVGRTKRPEIKEKVQ